MNKTFGFEDRRDEKMVSRRNKGLKIRQERKNKSWRRSIEH
jgi:hypothetical protein